MDMQRRVPGCGYEEAVGRGVGEGFDACGMRGENCLRAGGDVDSVEERGQWVGFAVEEWRSSLSYVPVQAAAVELCLILIPADV